MITAADVDAAMGTQTVPRLLRRNATEYGGLPAVTGADGSTWTWRRLSDRVLAVASGLRALGLRRGDRMLIDMSSRPEHWVVDFAAAELGAVPCTTYATLSPEQIRHIARHSAATVVVLEGAAELDRWKSALAAMPWLKAVVVLDGARDHLTPYAELAATPPAADDFERVEPDDPVAMIYTSGTTGDPKGVVLSHRNVLYQCAAQQLMQPGPLHPRQVAYLPLAHVAERVLGMYLPVYTAGHVTICQDAGRLPETLRAVRPHGFFGVPRVWEKFAAGVQHQLSGLDEGTRGVIERARELAGEVYRIRADGGDVPGELARAHAEADRTVLGPLRERLGLAEAIRTGSGSAPISAEALEFFGGLGLTITEVWGLSETTGAATTTYPDRYRPGTVGLPLPGMEVRLAADGEVEVRGPLVFLGYLRPDGRIESPVDSDGWLATGDLGAFDADGMLRITGRKKELIITSSGKNIAPSVAESLLCGHPLIGHAVLIGDRRPYVTALLVLDEEAAPAWAEARGLATMDLATLAADPLIRRELAAAVQRANGVLSRPEQIKAFRVLGDPWGPDSGELTPTLKLKRRVIEERYAAEIDELYAGGRTS
ncbi:AMP-dependent synthetase/ligase [Actinoallomurus sp. NPDC052274]|uniref:AMP-dependent synthetase/ligase n=1 Tax=Actinoallomurus sp. NPDC052274 TaxID=3155420 RepID=UPI003445E326